MELSFDDFEVKEEVSAENTETTKATPENQAQEKIEAESSTKTEAESNSTEEELKAETGENSGAESPATEYTPNFKYNIKDAEHEFPEWIREVVKSEEREAEVRDIFTKLDAFDGIKESRDKFEADYNTYKTGVESEIYPVLDKISEFDRANDMKDFGKAWELSDVNPTDVIDYLMMDKNLSEQLYQKVLEQVEAEPQVLEAKRSAWQEQQSTRAVEMQNKALQAKLNNLEEMTYNQALDFAIGQQQDKASSFDNINGQGAFRNFVTNLKQMKSSQGVNVQPVELIGEAMNMLGLNNAQPTAPTGNIENNNQQTPQVAPQEQKQPATLPNLGTGSNVSMVQKVASNFDEWEKQLQQG